MRLSQAIILGFVALVILLSSQAYCDNGVVTVDAAAKSAASSVKTLDAKGIKVQGDQVGLYIRSLIFTPQTFTLKTTGLADQDYDIYIDQEFKFKKTAKELEKGIELSIVGRTANPAQIRCLEAALPKTTKANSRLVKIDDPEAKRIAYTLSQASGWASTAINREQRRRAVTVILAPTGKILKRMTLPAQSEEAKVVENVDKSCDLFQQARDRMFRVIKNSVLRNEAVVALTPVDFAAKLGVRDGKPVVEATLLNECDLPISGIISISLPENWKYEAKDLAFKDLSSGKTHKVTFELVSASKDGVVLDSVPLAASVSIGQGRYRAEFNLSATAKAEAK